MPRILLTRPRAQSEAFAAEIAADGWEAMIWPVMEIVTTLRAAPDWGDAEAAILTSARAAEALASFGAPPLPAWCVGRATAAAARAVGFSEAIEGGGDADALLAGLLSAPGGGPRRLVHLRGREAAGDLAGALRAAGREAREIVAYAAEPGGPPPEDVDAAMRAGRIDGAALFSPRSAALFAEGAPEAWCSAYSAMTAFAISAAAAAPLSGLGFGAMRVSDRPDAAAFRAMLRAAA